MNFVLLGNVFASARVVQCLLLVSCIAQAQWKYTGEVSGLDIGFINTLAVQDGYVFAGTGKEGIFRSPVTGERWTRVDSGLAEKTIFSLAISGPFLVAGTSNGLFRSSDNGEAWVKADSGLEHDRIWELVGGDSILFAGTATGVFRSFDHGATWSRSNGADSPTSASELALAGTHLVAVVPQSILASGDEGIYGSADNGASWVRHGTSSLDLECLAAGGSDFFVGYASDRGVRRSSNGGESWVTVNNGLLNSSIHSLAADSARVFAGTFDGYISVSLDRGATWKDTGLPFKMDVRDLLITKDALWAAVGSEVMKLPFSETITVFRTAKSSSKGNRARLTTLYDANGRLIRHRSADAPPVDFLHPGAASDQP